MSRVKIKFCGITRPEDAKRAVKLGVDYLGVIFAPSLRQVSLPQAKNIFADIDATVQRIGVFQNSGFNELIHSCDALGLDGLQLHGLESAAYAKKIKLMRPKLTIIKSISNSNSTSTHEIADFPCDYLLFDSPKDKSTPLADRIAKILASKMNRPFFIAGGLSPANVNSTITKLAPYGVDVSRGIELRPGIKSFRLMNYFVAQIQEELR